MFPDAVDAAERVPHGGTTDRDLVEFSANLNPYTPDGVRDAYERAFDDARRYPDDDYATFREAAAAAVARDATEPVAVDQVVPTPGGLAAIRLAMATTLTAGDRVLLPKPSFGEYAREVSLQGATSEFVAHDTIVAAGLPDTDRAPNGVDALSAYAMVVVCNPNNPTGDAVDPAALRALAERCRAAETLVLVDEAFLGFTDAPSIAGLPGVVVARSLTKLYGLPGLRAGYAVATGRPLTRLRTARRAWNLGNPAAAVGAHCLRDREFVTDTRERVRTERARLCDRIVDDLPAAVTVRDGVAPFVLVDVGDRDVEPVVAGCRAHGIAVRDATTFRDLDRHVRVAVRTPDENDELLATLQAVLEP